MAIPPPALLTVDAVQAVYQGAIAALHGVGFEVRAGEIHALLGANGAGKSTTLKAVSHLLPAERGQVTAGRITYDGQDVAFASPATLVRAGLVPVLEGRHCFPSLSVEDNLITGALGHGARRREIAQDLERVYTLFPRLRDKRRTPAGLTSGGEQQMTAIGRALMSRPRLLVLDEPSMGLAPQIVDEVFAIVKDLNAKERVTFLLAEQNTSMALRNADYGYILENGRVVMDGAAAALATNEDVKEFYLGMGGGERRSFKDVKSYKRRKRWLA